ncbi:MAG TPA: sugar transferase [Fimbriimonas sp.]|nr:sugar transferase [Fimbriimonas sp.]
MSLKVQEPVEIVDFLKFEKASSVWQETPSVRPPSERLGYRIGKRVMDIVLALGALILLSVPVFLVVSIIIVATDGFPIFYRQRRVGLNGKLFWIYKFRSMRKDADRILLENKELLAEFEKNFKLEKDPRITPIGNFIRKTSIDEFPQFLNVLLGNMSLVGPRPVVERELETLYGADAAYYTAVKPGCAGLWQCSGRSDTTYEERVALDVRYVKEASLSFDVVILVRTFFAIVLKKGAR